MTDLRKIDALIAEHVFDAYFEATTHCPHCKAPLEHIEDMRGYAEPTKYRCDAPTDSGYQCDWRFLVCPLYSTDIALAIGVLEKLESKNPDSNWAIIRLNAKPNVSSRSTLVGYEIRLFDGRIYREAEYSCPLPEAITRHVLHVLGVPIE